MTAPALRRLRAPRLLPLLLLVATSCALDAPAPSFTVTDSAGVRVAESGAPAWKPGEGWVIDSVPLLDIGDELRGAGHDLSEVDGVVRLGDGRIAVANEGSLEIRFYDGSGNFLGAIGRAGEGPGEYRAMRLLGTLAGDSLLISDSRLQRITVLHPNGTLARTARLEPASFYPVLAFADGSILGRTGFSFGRDTPSGTRQVSARVARFGADGLVRDTLGEFPGGTVFVLNEGGRSFGGTTSWTPAPQYAPHPDGFVFGSAETHAFEIRAPDGRLAAIIRARRPLAQLTDGERRRILQPDPEMDPGFRRMIEATLPTVLPAYDDIATAADGHVWVRDYTLPLDSMRRADTWHVFDPEGRWLGPVELPAAFQVLSIADDAVLGVGRDALDIEHVRVYRIRGMR